VRFQHSDSYVRVSCCQIWPPFCAKVPDVLGVSVHTHPRTYTPAHCARNHLRTASIFFFAPRPSPSSFLCAVSLSLVGLPAYRSLFFSRVLSYLLSPHPPPPLLSHAQTQTQHVPVGHLHPTCSGCQSEVKEGASRPAQGLAQQAKEEGGVEEGLNDSKQVAEGRQTQRPVG